MLQDSAMIQNVRARKIEILDQQTSSNMDDQENEQLKNTISNLRKVHESQNILRKKVEDPKKYRRKYFIDSQNYDEHHHLSQKDIIHKFWGELTKMIIGEEIEHKVLHDIIGKYRVCNQNIS